MQNQLLWSHQRHEIEPKPKKKLIIKVQNNLKWAIPAAVKKILSFVKLTEKVIKVMVTQPKLCVSKLKLSDRRVHDNKVTAIEFQTNKAQFSSIPPPKKSAQSTEVKLE